MSGTGPQAYRHVTDERIAEWDDSGSEEVSDLLTDVVGKNEYSEESRTILHELIWRVVSDAIGAKQASEAIKDAEASEKILRAILDAIWLVSMEVEQFEAAEEKHTSAPWRRLGGLTKRLVSDGLIAQNLAMEQLRGNC